MLTHVAQLCKSMMPEVLVNLMIDALINQIMSLNRKSTLNRTLQCMSGGWRCFTGAPGEFVQRQARADKSSDENCFVVTSHLGHCSRLDVRDVRDALNEFLTISSEEQSTTMSSWLQQRC
jgi:hypothetical protein